MPPAKNTSNKDDEKKAAPTPPSNHDEIDVPAALARKTQDGKGDGPVPPSDFHSFETAGVEKTLTLLSIEDVTSEVLAGRWGPNEKVAAERLGDAGYDVAAVAEEFAHRKNRGAPSAF